MNPLRAIEGGFLVLSTEDAMVHSGAETLTALGTALRAQPS